MKRPARVAVIGVGVIGVGVGWNLSRHGAEVVLIDEGRPGEGVTNWSFCIRRRRRGRTGPRVRRTAVNSPSGAG
ncbi:MULTISPECIES: FAD-dependent oxidoreductase [unclassified Streptomyces]|uniref:FAD-dependent oxidoreductase n=1 Tax=unclassified Streptomyces TaxID=2593676 RepID=UPI002E1F500C